MRIKFAFCVYLSLLVSTGVFTAASAVCQGNLNAGLPGQNSVSIPVEFGSVNTSNGNLILTIPLASIPQRHGPPVTVSMVYNSSFWYQYENAPNGEMLPSGGPPGAIYHGFNIVADSDLTGSMSFNVNTAECPGGSPQAPTFEETYNGFVFTDQYGGSIPLGWNFTENSHCANGGLTYPAGSDAQGNFVGTSRHVLGPAYTSHIQALPSSGGIGQIQVWDQSGNLVTSGIKDTNGNFSSGVDQLGRSVETTTCPNSSWYTQGGTCTVSVLSSQGPVSYTIVYSLLPVCTNFAPLTQQYCGNIVVPTTVTRPDNSTFVFTWDTGTGAGHYGTLTDIKLPTGGHLHYTYAITTAPYNAVATASVSDGHGTTSFAYALNTAQPSGIAGRIPNAFFTTSVTTPVRYDVPTKTNVTDHAVYTYGVYSGAAENVGIGGGTAPAPTPLLFQSQDYGASTLLRTRTYNWNIGPQSLCCDEEFIDDSGTHTVTTTLNDTGQTSSASFTFVPSTNLINTLQEDVGKADARTTVTTYVNDTNNNNIPYNSTYHIYDKPISKVLFAGSATSGTPVASTSYVYDEYSANYCTPGVPMLAVISGATGHDDTYGSSYVGRGNVTTTKRLLYGSTYATSHQCYDTLGNVTQTVDPNGYPTSYSYVDSWFDSNCSLSSTYSAPTTITNALGQIGKRKYWSCSGLLAQSQDPNDLSASRTGTTLQYDFAGRTTFTGRPDGGTTTTIFSDSTASSQTTTCCHSNSTSLVDKSIFDDLGRKTQSQSEVNGTTTIYSDIVYDAGGRVSSHSSPYYTKTDATYGVTTLNYDGLGRVVLETQPDSTTQSWTYSGTSVTSRDEASNQWVRTSDLLGRLTQVLEPSPVAGQPPLETDYTYDYLDDLISVVQHGTTTETPRTRTFLYDAASRLLWSSNPESGVTCYGHGNGTIAGCAEDGYDAAGNLRYKTDARSILTTLTYDLLNRLKQKSYSDGTPSALFGYDGKDQNGNAVSGSTNSVGRLSYLYGASNVAESFGYDAGGRMAYEGICLPSQCGSPWPSATAHYDSTSFMTDLTYPSGRHITQTPDSAGRLSSSQLHDISGVSQTQSYLTGVTYWADGSPDVTTLGNGVQQTALMNSRLQVQSLNASSSVAPFNGQALMSHTYCYVNCAAGLPVANNGDIGQITDTLNNSRTQSFTYDGLNRISSFSLSGAVNQQYSIDSFGNMSRVVHGGQATTTFAPSTNRVNNLPCAGSATPFDSAGDQTCDSDQFGGVRQYKYDAESHISQIATLGSASPFVSYVYRPDGSRVRKTNATGTFTEYVDFGGQQIAARDQNGMWTDFIYANGNKIAKVAPTFNAIHVHGIRDASVNMACGTNFDVAGAGGLGHLIQGGDQLMFSQKATLAQGGITFLLDDGSYAGVNATDGMSIFNDTTPDGTWHNRVASLSALQGRTIEHLVTTAQNNTPAGTWDEYFADISIISSDGTVTTVLNNQTPSGTIWSACGVDQPAFSSEQDAPTPDARSMSTTYYLADHLGSTQMEFAAGGWPLWLGQYEPFGQELDSGTTNMVYKFTGKERDTESGLDYFGARYYSSSMGRFSSPDPSGLKYANSLDPQTLNLYAYARNNPLKYTDPTGLFCYYGDTGGGAQQDADNADASQWDYHSSQSECETADENGNKGVWTNDDYTHPDANGDMVDDDNRPNLYTIGSHTPIPDNIMNGVQNTLSAVQANGSYLNGIQNYSAMDVFNWSWRGVHHPNGPHGVYWHGNWCGAGGSGSPVDAQDAACLVHDFLYAQYGYTAGSNLDGYNPGLQEINQGLCDTAGSTLITAYFNFGVQAANLDPKNISNPSCHQ